MDRRGFLDAIMAAGIAPAIVRSDSLMKIFVPRQEIITLEDWAKDSKLYTGEIGKIDNGIRFITSPQISIECLKKISRTVLKNSVKASNGGYVVFFNSEQYDWLKN